MIGSSLRHESRCRTPVEMVLKEVKTGKADGTNVYRTQSARYFLIGKIEMDLWFS